MTYFWQEPLEECPYCNAECHADFVDNGFGPYAVQCGPYHCIECGASEIGPEGMPENATPIMKETGWYEPESQEVSPYANTIGGAIVGHITAKMAYEIGLLDVKSLPDHDEDLGDPASIF